MPSANDVAKYILEQKDEMDTWKLQKLVYYSQAWHLVWDSEPLFEERIEAWANGPVVPELYKVHRGKFKMKKWPKGNISRLTKSQRESIDVVLKRYGKRTGFLHCESKRIASLRGRMLVRVCPLEPPVAT
jgi:uncharacterized phage-associated protein